jgi:hypothetical protein
MSDAYPSARFFKLDVDEVPDVAQGRHPRHADIPPLQGRREGWEVVGEPEGFAGGD